MSPQTEGIQFRKRALEKLFHEAYPLARRVAAVRAAAAVSRASVPVHDREDLEQESLTAVWRALPRHDHSRGGLHAFVEVVTRTRFASLLRSRRYESTFDPLEKHPLLSVDTAPALELRIDVHTVLCSLEERDRQTALLLADHTPSEASVLLGITLHHL